jgi:hypothetical protein
MILLTHIIAICAAVAGLLAILDGQPLEGGVWLVLSSLCRIEAEFKKWTQKR